ncbi:MAG: Gfo/Idh/MocA family oxidoreductase [Planctomycetes bacterium]|nr:Gfo/Idh/MocA family oxidoreductase [Planctomycetota bacterium]
MSTSLSRRAFLHSAAAAVTAPWVRTSPWSGRRLAANERIGIGVIGVGDLGGGGHHLGRLLRLPEVEVVAVCDVDAQRVQAAVDKCEGRASGHKEYRELLDRKDVDAVVIVTPDHWHALQAIDACAAGKDVYCEKPLTLTVAEGRAITAAAQRFGRVFQTGTQQRSDQRFRWACELVRNGRIGRVQTVTAVLGSAPFSAPEPDAEVPPHLDWDLWLGPAPRVPYNPRRCHYQFRWFYDYSGGKLTDWGAHHIDIVQWGLGAELSGPLSVHGTGTWPADNFFETATEFDVHYEYPGGVRVHVTSRGENGVTFRGSEGEVFVSRGAIRANPKEILDTRSGTMPVKLPVSTDHHADWLRCIRTRAQPICHAEIGHRSATACHLGNIALLLGRKLYWDAQRERFQGDPDADRLLTKPMRAPWSL